MRTLGIVAHSAEGGGLCFLEACRDGARVLGTHMHPPIVMSCVPMALSMPAWEAGDHDEVGRYLAEGVRMVADAGADFYICPDNTAHIVLERIAHDLPIPGLHIAKVVCDRIAASGWTRVGLLGTAWTMTGPVYERALAERGMERLVPPPATRSEISRAIFEELCCAVFREETTARFIAAIDELRRRGAEYVILGCTEIPLIISDANSPLPVVDSPRLLARAAVALAAEPNAPPARDGWL